MIIIRPLIKVLSKIMELPKGSFLDPTTLGSGNPDDTNFLRGDGTWSAPTVDGYVPDSRTITIDGVSQDLSADRTWDVIPSGGTTGQILAKLDDTSYNLEWIENFANYTSTLKHEVKAGEAMTKGQAVYVSSADGTNMIVSKASNATEATSSKTMGLIAQTLAHNGKGFVITEGLLAGLNTASATAGDPVWLGTGGNLIYGLINKPAAPAHLVFIGIVTRANVSNGEIFIRVQNGFELQELHNVAITSVADNNLLQYDSATSLWKNESLSTAGVQPTLVSGTSIKTINTISLLGSGDITIGGGGITVGTTAVTSGTIGRVFFQGTGDVVQQSASLFWDNTNARLGVGATPATTVRLDVRAQGALSTDIAFRVRNSADTANIITANGRGDVFIGLNSGRITTGINNTFIGIQAGYSNITGQENTAIGANAGLYNLGSYNTYLGTAAGQNGTTATGCTFIGYNSGASSNAQYGVFIGYSASTTGGSGTVAIGYNAGAGTGSHNLSLGQSSGIGMTTGSFNTHLGYRSVGSGVTTGNYNNLLGSDIVVGAVSNTAVLADNQGNIAIRKDASHFVGVGYSGTATLGAKLDIKSQGALVTNLALRVRNSADTSNLFVVKGNGVLNAASLPTSSAGLVAGDIWNNLGILSIV